MLGEILEINGNKLTIAKNNIKDNILNLYLELTDDKRKYIAEITGINKDVIFATLLGEIHNNRFIYGVNQKPAFSAKVALLPEEDVKMLFSSNATTSKGSLYLGKSVLYENLNVFASLNSFFSSHFVILGNTGSGKSCGTARFLQNVFYKKDVSAKNATFFIIDAYGEYENAFKQINCINKDLAFKSYTTENSNGKFLQLPLWLLTVDDICLLLGVNQRNQIPIVEKALKLVNVFVNHSENQENYRNSIIARAILDIFINGKSSAQIRDQVFSVLSRYNTPTLNLDTPIYQPGYTRPFKQCLIIDDTGKIKDMQLIITFLQTFLIEDMHLEIPDGSYIYTLKDLLYAFDFALIDEGMLNNENIFILANELRVRLASIIDGEYNKFFEFKDYFNKETFFHNLITLDNHKAQVINLNLSALDDRFAKVIAKIYSKFIFDYSKASKIKASIPVHLILEEAHRYVQKDIDIDILGYNIFERIAKEGRKYGVLLGLISQRPSELSQTVLSQCNNFIVFKITHPVDIDYVKAVVPYVDNETVEKIKNLQTGTCLTFGNAFRLPVLTKVDLASPMPNSSSADIENTWYDK